MEMIKGWSLGAAAIVIFWFGLLVGKLIWGVSPVPAAQLVKPLAEVRVSPADLVLARESQNKSDVKKIIKAPASGTVQRVATVQLKPTGQTEGPIEVQVVETSGKDGTRLSIHADGADVIGGKDIIIPSVMPKEYHWTGYASVIQGNGAKDYLGELAYRTGRFSVKGAYRLHSREFSAGIGWSW